MKRVRVTGHRLPRVVDTSKPEPRVDPQVLADALDADPISGPALRQWGKNIGVHPRNLVQGLQMGHEKMVRNLERLAKDRSRLAKLERRERLLAAWLEHAKKRDHDAATIACLEDWLAGDENPGHES